LKVPQVQRLQKADIFHAWKYAINLKSGNSLCDFDFKSCLKFPDQVLEIDAAFARLCMVGYFFLVFPRRFLAFLLAISASIACIWKIWM